MKKKMTSHAMSEREQHLLAVARLASTYLKFDPKDIDQSETMRMLKNALEKYRNDA